MSPTSNLSFEELQSEPDRTAVREVIASVAGRGFEVVDVARMEGGIENGCHRLTAESADGKRLRFVLRRYSWRPNVPSPAARCSREWALLQALRRAGGPVPRPRWFDDSGKVFELPPWSTTSSPAALCSRLKGQVDGPEAPQRPCMRSIGSDCHCQGQR